MKISIISVTEGQHESIASTRASVEAQKLPEGVELEHIIVTAKRDMDSTSLGDAKVIYREPSGCYDAINVGLQTATGQVIGLLNGGDRYASDNIIALVAEQFGGDDIDFLYGDVYFSRRDGSGCSRYYSSRHFSPETITKGFVPPHPSLFISRKVYEAVGLYDTSFAVSSDFDYFIRIIDHRPTFRYRRLNLGMVCMKPGGISTKWRVRLFVTIFERYRALKKNRGHASFIRLFGRYMYLFKR